MPYERADGDAVTPQTRPGIEGAEAEWLGAGGADDLPDVDPHPVEQHLQLVHQGDVHAAVGVLQDLGRLGDLQARDGHEGLDGDAVDLQRPA